MRVIVMLGAAEPGLATRGARRGFAGAASALPPSAALCSASRIIRWASGLMSDSGSESASASHCARVSPYFRSTSVSWMTWSANARIECSPSPRRVATSHANLVSPASIAANRGSAFSAVATASTRRFTASSSESASTVPSSVFTTNFTPATRVRGTRRKSASQLSDWSNGDETGLGCSRCATSLASASGAASCAAWRESVSVTESAMRSNGVMPMISA